MDLSRFSIYLGDSCSITSASILIHSSYADTDSIPENINDGVWITGDTPHFNRDGTGGRNSLEGEHMFVMSKSEQPEVIGCCIVTSALSL